MQNLIRIAPPPRQCEILTLADGRRLAYAPYGIRTGSPVIYFHGGLSSRLDIAFADSLCRRMGIFLIAPDRPGIGRSDFQPQRRMRDWAEDVRALADALNLERFALLGWSGGGPYVLAAAAALGARVTAAATVASMAPLDRPQRLRELGMAADRALFPLAQSAPRLAAVLLALARSLPAPLLRASLIQSLSGADRHVVSRMPTADATEFFYEALRAGARGTVADYRILGTDWDLDGSAITCPLTLWQGEADRLVPPAHAEVLQARLPQARLMRLPGCGHFLLRTNARDVFASLLTR